MRFNVCGREAVRHKLKSSQKTQKAHFFACFWAYVGHPHDHISWATPMPLASINSTNPRTNPWNFHEKILKIWRCWKMSFFLRRPFWFSFCFISVKNPALLYKVSFFSSLWMVFPESWKRSCPNFHAHDCTYFKWLWRPSFSFSFFPKRISQWGVLNFY